MKYTEEYQRELISKCCNKQYMDEVGRLLKPELFLVKYQPLVSSILSEYSAGRYLSRAQLEQTAKEHNSDILGNEENTNLEFDRKQVTDWLCYQILRKGFKRAHAKHETGEYDAAIHEIEQCRYLFPASSLSAPDILREEVRLPKRVNICPTGLQKLDSVLVGGPSGGDVLTVLSVSGGGKSSMLVNMGFNFSVAGFNVYHLTLEDPADAIISKYKARAGDWDVVRKSISGSLYVKEHAPDTLTVADIDRNMPKDINVCLIDYDDYIKPSSSSAARHEELGRIYGEIKQLAMKRKIPVVVACQATSEGYEADVLRMEHCAGSREKPRKSTHVISLTPNPTKPAKPGCKWLLCHVAKNKHGIAGNTIHMEVDFSTCIFTEGMVE